MENNYDSDIRKCRKHNQRFDIADGQCCSGCESESDMYDIEFPAGCECEASDWEDWDYESDGQIPEVCPSFINNNDNVCYECWHLEECHKN